MPPIKFLLNPTYRLGGDVVWRISRWPPWRQSWISERNHFSNSEPPMPPIKFQLNLIMVWEEISFAEFQDGRHGDHLGYQNTTILAILNLCITVMPPIKFQLKRTYGLGGNVVWRMMGYRNGMILAILNLCVNLMLPILLAQSDLQFGRCHLKNFKMATMRPSWILERNDFSNSESLCSSDASHQVSAQSDLWFGRRCHLKNFRMAAMAAILDIGTELF